MLRIYRQRQIGICTTLFSADRTSMIGFRSPMLISRCNSFLFELRCSKEQEQRHVSPVDYLTSYSLISAFKEFDSRRNLSCNHCLHSPCAGSVDHRWWPRPTRGVVLAMRQHFYRSHLGSTIRLESIRIIWYYCHRIDTFP